MQFKEALHQVNLEVTIVILQTVIIILVPALIILAQFLSVNILGVSPFAVGLCEVGLVAADFSVSDYFHFCLFWHFFKKTGRCHI